jgi:hypothetical protein
VLGVVLTLAVLAAPAGAGSDSTVVQGVIPPEVAGRWLVVVHAAPSTGDASQATPPGGTPLDMRQTGSGRFPLVRTWDVRRDGSTVTVRVHRGRLPERLAREADAPDAAVLREVAAHWDALAAGTGEPQTVTATLLDVAHAPPGEATRLRAPDTRFFIAVGEEYTPGTGLARHVATYAVTAVEADRLVGRFAGAMMLPPQVGGPIALPPIPVALDGDFVAYRVPEPSVLTRLLDVFAGCGKRAR